MHLLAMAEHKRSFIVLMFFPHFVCDKMISPTLLYGCQKGTYTGGKIIESVHLKVCKYLLNVKSSTPNHMIYSELGRFPLSIQIVTRVPITPLISNVCIFYLDEYIYNVIYCTGLNC